MAARGARDAMVLATKVGSKHDRKGLTADNVCVATEESLRRLQTDPIDLLYTHRDDEVTPPQETLAELDALVREGKVRHVAASNASPERLEAAMEASEREGLARYVALQPHYNLVERGYENGLADVCRRHDLGCLPYFALAKGFLTGKYRPGADEVRSERAMGARAYLDERGERVLAALDAAGAAHDVPVAAMSVAWLAAQPTVVSPIASARTPAQLAELMAMTDVELSADELRALDDASAWSAVAQDGRALGQHRYLGGGEHLVLGSRAGAQAREAERALGTGQHHVARASAGDHGARREEDDLGEGVEQRGRLAAGGAPRRRVDEVHEVHAAGAQDAAHLVLVLDGRQVGGDDGAENASVTTTSALRAGCRLSSSRPSPSRTRSPGSARRSSTVPSACRTAGSLS